MRAVGAALGLILTVTGLIVTFTTGNVDGWTVLAAIGVALLWNDLRIEQREAEGVRPVSFHEYTQADPAVVFNRQDGAR